MSMTFSIKSTASDRELAFLSPRPDHFIVELRGAALGVKREVYAYTDTQGLSNFFSSWESLEGEFSISAQCSALGHVSFFIRIRDMRGGPEECDVSAQVVTELGALTVIAKHAKSFFDVVAGA